MTLPSGTILQHRYEIQAPLEPEGNGPYYQGLDLHLGRKVRIRAFPLPSPRDDAGFAELDRCSTAIAGLAHPRIDPFLDMGMQGKCGFVVSEWQTGEDLAQRLRRGPLPWPEARRILAGVGEALQAAHALGVCHGRLTPAAILLLGERDVRVRDFSHGPSDRLAAGDPHLAPEAASGEATPESDWYACGILLRDMLGDSPGTWPGEARQAFEQLTRPEPGGRLAPPLADPPETPAPKPRHPGLLWGLGAVSLGMLLVWSVTRWATKAGPEGSPKGASSALKSNPEAYEAYRRAQFSLARRNLADLRKAEEAFKDCLRLRPDSSEAASGLAVSYALLGVHRALPRDEAAARALKAAQRALALDPTSSEATSVLAYLEFRYNWNWEHADALFREAIRKNPDLPLNRHWYGFYLSAAGRHAEAVRELGEACRLDPTDLQGLTNLAVAQVWAGQGEAGLATFKRTLDLDPGFLSARDRLVLSLESLRRFPEALEEWQILAEKDPSRTEDWKALRQAWLEGGEPRYWRERLRQYQRTARGQDATIWAAEFHGLLGENDLAFAELEKAVADRDLYLVWTPQDPLFAELRKDPRFKDFLHKIRYPGS